MAYCSNCGAEIPAGARFCPGCGQGQWVAKVAQPQAAPKRKRAWLFWLLLIGAVFVILVVACVAVALLIPTGEGTPAATSRGLATRAGQESATQAPLSSAGPTQTDAPTPTATPVPLAPPYVEIHDNYEEMTEAQWKTYKETLRGLAVVDWVGWVTNVDKVPLGTKYQLFVDMDSPDAFFSTSDVVFKIPEKDALKYNKDQQVRFSGTIDFVSVFVGDMSVNLSDVTVTIIE